LVVTFAGCRRWNGEVELILITDVVPPSPYSEQLIDLGVSLLLTTFDHRPPDGFYKTFSASLYTIDAMHAVTRHAESLGPILLLDPDVLCLGDLSPVFDAIDDVSVLAYPTGLDANVPNQGLSALDAMPMHETLDSGLTGPPAHFGGEMYGFTPAAITDALVRVEDAWQLALANFRRGQAHFVTEEHLLNYALRRSNVADGREFIRRIWTAPVFRNVRGDEGNLLLWHLPAEKDRAFVGLSLSALDRQSWFWSSDRESYIAHVGGFVGIPRRGHRSMTQRGEPFAESKRRTNDIVKQSLDGCVALGNSATATVGGHRYWY
jgi:hypothetical protein